MAQQSRLLRKFVTVPILMLTLMIVAAACGDGPPQGTAPQAPATGGEAAPAAGSEAAPAAAEGAAGDEYQASREACTTESPCWPSISDTMPTAFSEAPTLAERVASGDLPAVEERLPVNPLVIEPAEMIGSYGGTLRGAFTGPGDRQNYERWINDYTLFWDAGATELRPRLAHKWESNEDATVWTIYLREGLKWSDGEPFTADDYIFWREYIVANDELVPAKQWWINWGGELATFEKIDDYTFSITFADSFPTWPVVLASSTVSGYLQGGRTGGGLYAPHHYLEQFHPDFIGADEATAKAKEAGFETWNLFFLAMADAAMNPDSPVMAPWKPVTILASDQLNFERNPYFWAVDTEGNQLPYFDGISLELVEELEVLNLRAIAGNYTIQGRHIDFAKLPVIRENQAQGDYFVDFWTSSTRNPAAIYINQDWNADPDIAAYTVGSLDFRKALSLAIERSEINETYFLGVGTESSLCPANASPYFTSDRWDQEFGRFAPDESNTILDSIGLDQKDSEGYRLLPSGERLVLRIDAVSGSFLPYPDMAESIGQMWKDIGIQLIVNPVERNLWIERSDANEPMMSIFETGDWNPETDTRLIPQNRWSPVAMVWGNTPNPDPADYDGPQWQKDQILKHWEAIQTLDPAERRQRYIEGMEILCDNQPILGLVVGVPTYTTLIKNSVRNVPKPFQWVVYAQTPGNGLPEQMFMIQE